MRFNFDWLKGSTDLLCQHWRPSPGTCQTTAPAASAYKLAVKEVICEQNISIRNNTPLNVMRINDITSKIVLKTFPGPNNKFCFNGLKDYNCKDKSKKLMKFFNLTCSVFRKYCIPIQNLTITSENLYIYTIL